MARRIVASAFQWLHSGVDDVAADCGMGATGWQSLAEAMTRKKPAKRPGPAFEGCAMCDGTGFRRVMLPRDREPYVTRCDCWYAHQQRIADLEEQQATKR